MPEGKPMLRSMYLKYQRLGLQRRIGLYVFAGLLAFSTIVSIVARSATEQSLQLAFRERLLAAQFAAHAVDVTVGEIHSDLSRLSSAALPQRESVTLAELDGALAEIDEHWRIIHAGDAPLSLTITDRDGRALDERPAGADVIRRYALTEAILKSPEESSLPASGDATQAPILMIVPISRTPASGGYLVAEYRRAAIADAIRPLLTGSASAFQFELFDVSGVLIVNNPGGRPYTGDNPHLKLIAPFWAANRPGTETHETPGGGHVIAFAPLSRMRWGVIVEQPLDEAMTLPRMLLAQLLTLGVIALAAGLVFARITTRAVVRPVNALIDATREIAGGDLDHKIDVSGTDEVGTLARGFDDMRLKLMQSREQIAGLNRDLEARVDQRTRELAALVKSAHSLASTLELGSLLELLTRETQIVLPDADGIGLFLYDGASNLLEIRSSFGLDPHAAAGIRLAPGEGIAGSVFQIQTPVVAKTAGEIRELQSSMTHENSERMRQATFSNTMLSALGVPLISKGVALGVLMLYNFSREDAFADNATSLLQALADQVATAIDNARLFKEASEVGTLREMNHLKSEFVARASHELRTPLTSIKSLAETLLRPDLPIDPATRHEFMQGIDSAADRLGGIVNDLLMLARVDGGQLQMRLEPVDVVALVRRVVGQYSIQFPAHRFEIRLPPELPPARCDPERCEDVINNLLSNAIKYSTSGTTVTVSAWQTSDDIEVAVADQGIGIQPEKLAQVFGRFFRIDNAVTRQVGGAGLGLHICKTYVEAMGGRIRAEGNPDHGSTFVFTLKREHA